MTERKSRRGRPDQLPEDLADALAEAARRPDSQGASGPRSQSPPDPRPPEAASAEPDDGGIEFGEVAHSAPDVALRPDQNKHFAVVAVGQPSPADLPIYVDLDAMCDMERHALDDTRVELGGVLLGGQYVDDAGRPFVLVSDSLRAEHYESTKGSFKFTHDTWSQISRQRDEFPDDLQMVGWYHTHPDWGVFLSTMDMFICDHFFNKPLDVALVIDPCRQDRGMFMWTRRSDQRVRRTDGFYLIASRFRERELELVAAQLEGTLAMAFDPRQSPYGAPPAVIQVGGTPQWMAGALLSLLGMQLALLGLLAWKVLAPAADAQVAAELGERIEQIERRRDGQSEVDAQIAVLDSLLDGAGAGGDASTRRLVELQRQLDEQRSTIEGQQANVVALRASAKQAEADLRVQEKERVRLEEESKKQQAAIDELKAANKRLTKSAKSEGDEEGWLAGNRKWWVAGLAGATLLLGGAALMLGRRRGERYDDPPPAPTGRD